MASRIEERIEEKWARQGEMIRQLQRSQRRAQWVRKLERAEAAAWRNRLEQVREDLEALAEAARLR